MLSLKKTLVPAVVVATLAIAAPASALTMKSVGDLKNDTKGTITGVGAKANVDIVKTSYLQNNGKLTVTSTVKDLSALKANQTLTMTVDGVIKAPNGDRPYFISISKKADGPVNACFTKKGANGRNSTMTTCTIVKSAISAEKNTIALGIPERVFQGSKFTANTSTFLTADKRVRHDESARVVLTGN